MDTSTIDQLCADIERAWIDRRDLSVLNRLAAQHEHHASELYDFFSSLNDAEDLIPAQLYEGALETNRIALQGKPFVKFLLERTGEELDAVARRIGCVTSEFLVLVSRFPALVPALARERLADKIRQHWAIPLAETLGRMRFSGAVAMAWSREDHPSPPSTFGELLERSSMTPRDRSYWLEFADGETPRS